MKGGPADELTQRQQTASNYYNRMMDAEQRMTKVLEEFPDFDPTHLGDALAERSGLLGNYFVSEPARRYRNAAKDWKRAKLRLESGAVIAKEEDREEDIAYFPMPGDDDNVIRQKAAARLSAAEGILQESSRGLASGRPSGLLNDPNIGVTPSGTPRISSDAEYDALPSGTVFIGPDGKTRRKP